MERFWVKESHSVSLFCSDDGSQFCHHTHSEKGKVNEMTEIRRRAYFWYFLGCLEQVFKLCTFTSLCKERVQEKKNLQRRVEAMHYVSPNLFKKTHWNLTVTFVFFLFSLCFHIFFFLHTQFGADGSYHSRESNRQEMYNGKMTVHFNLKKHSLKD